MAKDWVVAVRFDDSEENRKRVHSLMRHAYLKYGEQPGGMKQDGNISDFLRFLLNYYHTHEIEHK